MNHLDPNAMARTIIDERIRYAEHHHLVRECRRPEPASTARPAAQTPTLQRHSRLWSLVHLRHAYS